MTVPVGARSRSQCWRAFARQRQTVCRTLGLWYLGSLVAPMLAHIVVPVVDAIDFRPSSNGCGDCARGRAQSKRVWESDGATAQTVQFADLGSPVTRMLAHMLARAVDAIDFRPSATAAGLCPWARAVEASVREHLRGNGRQCADQGYLVAPMVAQHSVRATDFSFSTLMTATIGCRINAIVTRVGAGPIC